MRWLEWMMGQIVAIYAMGILEIRIINPWRLRRYSKRYMAMRGISFSRQRPDEQNPNVKLGYHYSIALIFTGILFAIDVVLASPYLHKAYAFLMSSLGLQGTQLVIAILVVSLGSAAHAFKLKNQRAYGVIEIIFAVAAAVVTAKQMSTTTQWAAQTATLCGAAYVVSRGLGNYAEGTRKRRLEWEAWLKSATTNAPSGNL